MLIVLWPTGLTVFSFYNTLTQLAAFPLKTKKKLPKTAIFLAKMD